MCLIANTTLTNTLKSFTGTITVYKNFKVSHKVERYKTTGKIRRITNLELIAMHQSCYKWSAKTHSVRPAPVVSFGNEVHKGIHVCLSEKEAKEAAIGYKPYVTIAFEVPISDVFAVGSHGWAVDYNNVPHPGKAARVNQQAVLKKLTITPKQRNKALAEWKVALKKSLGLR